jgi:hypothetical protein
MEVTNRENYALIYMSDRDFRSGRFSDQGDVVTQETKKSNEDTALKIAKWYDSEANLFPQRILDILIRNNISPQILETKAKFVVGNGIQTYIEVIEGGKKMKEAVSYPEVQALIDDEDIQEVIQNIAKDVQFFGNGFCELAFNMAGTGIVKLYHHDATTVRAGYELNRGRSKFFRISDDWNKKKSAKDTKKIAGFIGDDGGYSGTFMMQLKDYTPSHPHYSLPGWFGTLKWIELANHIPVWHLHGIRNGYSIRYMVEISDAYFNGIPQDKIKEAKRKLQDDLDTYLAGSENNGKALHATMSDHLFRNGGVIRITPIADNLNDTAFTQLFDQSNMASTSGHALDPTLAGIETAGKLSSGSEKRISFDIFHQLHAPKYRNQILKIFYTVSKINGWDKKYPGMKFGFSNIELTTLDENPTGKQEVL